MVAEAFTDSRRPRPPGDPAPDTLDQVFEMDGLHRLRRVVAAHADRLGVGPEQLNDLMVVAIELASNAIQHGGGTGRLRLWRRGSRVYCQVSDRGPGTVAADTGTRRPAPDAPAGRGLWICRQFCAQLMIESGDRARPGATVTGVIDIGGAAGARQTRHARRSPRRRRAGRGYAMRRELRLGPR